MRTESDVYHYQYNAHGDVVALTNENGTTVAQYTYDPWGNTTAITDGSGASVATDPNHIANINPYRYAGYRYDTESGLYYLQARYYDPGTFRFLTKDPDGGLKADGLSQNRYAYAKANPVRNVDPDGYLSFAVNLRLSSAVAAAAEAASAAVVGVAALPWAVIVGAGAVVVAEVYVMYRANLAFQGWLSAHLSTTHRGGWDVTIERHPGSSQAHARWRKGNKTGGVNQDGTPRHKGEGTRPPGPVRAELERRGFYK